MHAIADRKSPRRYVRLVPEKKKRPKALFLISEPSSDRFTDSLHPRPRYMCAARECFVLTNDEGDTGPGIRVEPEGCENLDVSGLVAATPVIPRWSEPPRERTLGKQPFPLVRDRDPEHFREWNARGSTSAMIGEASTDVGALPDVDDLATVDQQVHAAARDVLERREAVESER